MKKFGAFLLAVCLFLSVLTGCANSAVKTNAVPMGESGTWSVFLYLCGSNLETKMGAAGKNLDEILGADIPENVNVIVQTGGAQKWRSHDIPADSLNRWQVKAGRLSPLESLPQASMGDEQTFTDFLEYGVKNYPAEKMTVIVWDHGGGSLEGVANDENFSFDALSLAEMDGALKTVSARMTDRFELFGFDACLMANYETASMLEPYSRYLLASEEIEPGGGWDYGSLFSALAADASISGGELGKAVCDGYYAKCKKSGKEAAATLSVTDLQKLPALTGAFDTLAAEMAENAAQPKGIQAIAQSAKNAQKFGGTSSNEGFSNLADLRHFAENAVDLEGSRELTAAVDQAVVYKVGGPQKSKSGGLSFYYPAHVEANKLKSYYDGICPSEPYKTYLQSVYSKMPSEPIVFEDYGSVREDGSFGIKLSESSRNYVLSIDFLLVEYTKERWDGKQKIDASWLGQDNDCYGDLDTLDFHSNFRGIWLSLNGCKLFVTPVESTEAYIIFTAPILLNGAKTNLRFAFIWDDSDENGGTYKILGAWNGIDPVTGMSDKEIMQLKPTDVIQVYYNCQSLTVDAQGNEIDSDSDEKYLDVPGGTYAITEEPLEEQDYVYQFVVTDIFGERHCSYSAHMEMTKSAEELRENSLDDGEYAAKPTDIDESTSPVAEE